MNEISRYEMQLKKRLKCSAFVKRRFMCSFRKTLQKFTEEVPEPSFTQLTSAFGSPEEMAKVLMAEMTQTELTKYRRIGLMRKVAVCSLVAVFFCLALYVFIEKQKPLIIQDEGNDLGIVTEQSAVE